MNLAQNLSGFRNCMHTVIEKERKMRDDHGRILDGINDDIDAIPVTTLAAPSESEEKKFNDILMRAPQYCYAHMHALGLGEKIEQLQEAGRLDTNPYDAGRSIRLLIQNTLEATKQYIFNKVENTTIPLILEIADWAEDFVANGKILDLNNKQDLIEKQEIQSAMCAVLSEETRNRVNKTLASYIYPEDLQVN